MGIHKKDIPEPHWSEFCDAFSRQHRGWFTEISDVTPGSARRVIAAEAPLESLEITDAATAGEVGSDHDGSRRVRVSLRPTEEQEETVLAIPDPQRLKALREADGAHAGLEVDTPGGEIIELRFSSSARLESVDGIV